MITYVDYILKCLGSVLKLYFISFDLEVELQAQPDSGSTWGVDGPLVVLSPWWRCNAPGGTMNLSGRMLSDQQIPPCKSADGAPGETRLPGEHAAHIHALTGVSAPWRLLSESVTSLGTASWFSSNSIIPSYWFVGLILKRRASPQHWDCPKRSVQVTVLALQSLGWHTDYDESIPGVLFALYASFLRFFFYCNFLK